jgi:cytochrome c5
MGFSGVLEQKKGQILRLWRDTESEYLDQKKDRSGELVFSFVCASCHDASGNVAPQIKNRQDWQTRKSERWALYMIAIEGAGDMPEKGFCEECSDDEIERAVDFMLDEGPSHSLW